MAGSDTQYRSIRTGSAVGAPARVSVAVTQPERAGSGRGPIILLAVELLCLIILILTWFFLLSSSDAYRLAQQGAASGVKRAETDAVIVARTDKALGKSGASSSSAASASARSASASSASSSSAARNASQSSFPSTKLAGASETVDDAGVVHGTSSGGVDYVLYGRGQKSAEAGKITLAAVGDVFATTSNFPILDAYAGDVGDGEYDFLPYYRDVTDEITARDLRFINQETPCAGIDDDRDYSGYPVFNTPDSSVHALAGTGFNIVNFNSNHTWDMDEYGIERTHGLFAEHPGLMVIGSYASDEDRSAVRLVERNGATIAFLSYAYGDNSFGEDPGAFPNQYYTCQFDQDVMAQEIARAKQVADAVVVYMHWGTEYTTEPNDQQLEYAQFLADQDVDLVIGSHAHILQPIRYVTGAGGKQVPVVYGLSDFITGWTLTDTILSGMFTCDFTWSNGKLNVGNCSFAPAIEWSDGGDTTVRFLKDMTDEEIAENTRTEDVGDDVAYLHQFIDDLGMEVPVDW